MSDKPLDADGQSLNIDQLIADFKARAKAGEKFSFEKMLEAHPEHTDELTRYFKQWNESETPPQPDKAGAEESSTGTSAPGKLSLEDATAHTMIQGTGDSESSLTRDFQQPDTEATSEIEISKTFSRYEIQKVLGQGAMGAVYLAKDTQLDRDVALKIPKFGDGNGVDDQELLARFYREARASATLRSPNICPVYDVGEIDGQHYITMAFIEGRPLKDYTKSKKTHSEKQIIATIRKLALGLAEAHEIGVIHRDLKPANIMVDLKGEPVVMDFGLARRSSSDDVQVTQSGAIIGTPAYMAPEQVAGDQAAIDHRVDIYALGIIMYELITGEMPFKGNLMALLQQIALNNPTKPSELRLDIDPRLEAICLKMIAGDREQRYQSMTDVANDLQEVLRNPDERHKQAQAKKKGPKPKSLPTAKEESNPALISIDRSESSVVRLRANQGKKSSSTDKATAASKLKSSGLSKKLLIAGGTGGLLLLLGMAFFVSDGKQDVQITQNNPGITLKEKKPLPSNSTDEIVEQSKKDTSQKFGLAFNTKDAQVDCGQIPLDVSKPLAVELWCRPTTFRDFDSSVAAQQIAFMYGPFELEIVQMPNRPEPNWSLTLKGKGKGFSVGAPVKLLSNQPVHIACQWTGQNGQWELFVNGTKFDVEKSWGNFQGSSYEFLKQIVGQSQTGTLLLGSHIRNGDHFRGVIQQLRVSNRKVYDADFVPQALSRDRGTVALYNFDEGSGNILKDSSGNGHDGKIIDAKWVRVDTETIAASPPPPAIAPLDAAQAKVHQEAWADYLDLPVEKEVELPGGEKMAFVLIPPGEFIMGSTEEEQTQIVKDYSAFPAFKGILTSEGPQHRVRISRPFYMGKYEVTQSQWLALIENIPPGNPSQLSSTRPAENISWDETQVFFEKFNHGFCPENMQGMLPTEAQWEYACRAGTSTSWSFGDNVADLKIYAWFDANSSGKTQPAGKLPPNNFGLHDMHGNVCEWCFDTPSSTFYRQSPLLDPFVGDLNSPNHIYRGGNIHLNPVWCRSAFRANKSSETKKYGVGFRAIMKIDDVAQARFPATIPLSSNRPPSANAPFDAAKAKQLQQAWADYLSEPVNMTNSIGMKLVVIPPGSCTLGGAGDIPAPVKLTQPFRIGANEVTQGEWHAIMRTEPWKGQQGVQTGSNVVATFVNWTDAEEFCRRLTEKERAAGWIQPQSEYRLPTVAEWEYSTRAGTTSLYFFGDDATQIDEYAWYKKNTKDNSAAYAHGVGLKKPNPWGLYDVHGNVWELCSNWFSGRIPGGSDPQGPESGDLKSNRGGSWLNNALQVHSSIRASNKPEHASGALGFRVVRTINKAKDEQVNKSSSQTIDLLADLVPTTWNSEDMSWQIQDGILAGNSSASRKKKEWVGATFPQEIEGDYDFELELKNSGFAPLQVDLPLGDKQAIRLHLGGLGCALMQIDGKADRDAAPEHSNKDAKLKRNVWQLLTAKIRHHGENVSIDVALDGERIGQFSGSRSRITLPKWVKPDPVHVKFAGTGDSSILQVEFRRALVLSSSQAAQEVEQTKPQ